jgi:hypothetical protein
MPVNDEEWDHYHFEVMHNGSNTWHTYARWAQRDKVSVLDRYARQVLDLNSHYKAVRVSKVTSGQLAQPMSCHIRPGKTVPEWTQHGGFC